MLEAKGISAVRGPGRPAGFLPPPGCSATGFRVGDRTVRLAAAEHERRRRRRS
jgi:hypothetical protein